MYEPFSAEHGNFLVLRFTVRLGGDGGGGGGSGWMGVGGLLCVFSFLEKGQAQQKFFLSYHVPKRCTPWLPGSSRLGCDQYNVDLKVSSLFVPSIVLKQKLYGWFYILVL